MSKKHRTWIFAAAAWLLTTVAGAQTAWPDYISRLQPAVSESPVAAVLPEGGTMVPPDPTLPAARKRWHGLWQGWACGGMQCDVRIAVEQVTSERATVAYAGANALQGLLTDRAEGLFKDEELAVRLRTGSRLVLRLRADGDMEMSLWKPDTQLVSAGVLTQKPLASTYTRTIERVPTPWSDNGKAQTLEMVVFRPQGIGPFPTLIFHHGSTGRGNRPEWFKLTWTSPEIARYFTARGWQVLFPQRRGRGQSDGLYDEGFEADRSAGYSCQPRRALAGFDRAVEDLDVVMPQVLARPDVDSRHLMIGGVSRGGILAVGYAGMHPEMFTGVINFVGGWVGDACPKANEVNPLLMRRGAAFKQPMLWLYGDHDPFYALRHSRANFDSFTAAGGRGEFLSFDPPPGRDGHALHTEPSLWQPVVERYLAGMDRY
ncbi:alpha/beta hydrolase family protein [Variovorax sp. PAMC26660]|uniref:alpha/beta hydrolase family protein n=1 Tax=Variovorax sp. PAMC26660 TaxID=2762322 RepID=UPI001C9B00CD|nr:alpha/beta hydrolase [Variovorax sp. PAMC26660]